MLFYVPSRLRRQCNGVALIIVLAFIVLLTGLVVAFFSRASNERQVSNSSASQTSVELFAQGAVDIIVGDLKQEIAAGSVAPFPTPASNVTIYRPKAPATAVAAMVGANASAGTENLVKRSARGAAFYSGSNYDVGSYPPSDRAAAVSTLEPSRNGRSISPARWNKPLLLQKADPASDTDFTPTGATAASSSASAVWANAPDWVLVARDGSNPKALADVILSATKGSAVGARYAYTIYDEGGLLDANVAGYPSKSTPSQTAYKSALAFADLKQLTGISSLSAPDAVIDSLVGWRNYASSSDPSPVIGGTFPSYTWAIANANNYYKSIIGNSTGFLSAANQSVVGGQTDRMFSSRQQLISLLTQGSVTTAADRANIQNALQYLGTFSRDLDQPSLYPEYSGLNQNRSAVRASGTGQIGNSAYQNEASYNPPFLSIRVNTSFTRNDDSTAVVGEPLVKKRFALNRLAWITYKGASSSLSSTDGVAKAYLNEGNLSRSFLDQGTDAKIYQYFGLTRKGGNVVSGYWVYDHGISSDGSVVIGTLAQVRDAKREPDFFELLKAAINVGSVAKATARGGSGGDNCTGGFRDAWDQRVDFQILQIGANIIDQFDPDGYPTHLQLADKAAVLRDFYGKEDLPYLNAIHSVPIRAVAGGDPEGTEMVLDLPSIWNPIDASSNAQASGSLAPSVLRVTVVGGDIYTTVTPSTVKMRLMGNIMLSGTETNRSLGLVSWDSRDATALVFSNNSVLYREPTLLAQPKIPEGSGLALGADYKITTVTTDNGASPVTTTTNTWIAPIKEFGSNKELIGFVVGVAPLKSGTDPLFRMTRNQISNMGKTVRMEWADASGGPWYPYEEVYWDSPFSTVDGFSNPQPALFSNWSSTAKHSQVPYDPRTNRFSSIRGAGAEKPTFVLTNEYQLESIRTGATVGKGAVAGPTGSGFASNSDIPHDNAGWLSKNTWIYPGLSEQNNPKAAYRNGSSGDGVQYYIDPDGIARRAMGAYVPYGTATNGPAAKITIGLPLVSPKRTGESSRPIMLNRPFRTVGELGYVYRDTPWKNIDFFTPESGDNGLLDVFCIAPSDEKPDPLVAGRLNLNTKQKHVLVAMLNGAYRDEFDLSTNNMPSSKQIDTMADALIDRTMNASSAPNKGPLINIGDLVGRYVSGYTNTWGQPYDGFSNDLALPDSEDKNDIVQRFREAPIRALSSVGNTRTWNLLIDVVAQVGRYPRSAKSLGDFLVEGEQRYWVHVAIDRMTGEVIDKQVELVKE